MRSERHYNISSALEEMAQHVQDTSHLIASLIRKPPDFHEAHVSCQNLQSTSHFLLTQDVLGTNKMLSRILTGRKSIWPIMPEPITNMDLEDEMCILVTVF